MVQGASTRIDPKVLIGKANQRFANNDQNQDGKLTQLELGKSATKQQVQKAFDQFDLDQDGAISQAEQEKVISERAQRLRNNQAANRGSGRLRGAEKQASLVKKQPQRPTLDKQNLVAISAISAPAKSGVASKLTLLQGVKAYLSAK